MSSSSSSSSSSNERAPAAGLKIVRGTSAWAKGLPTSGTAYTDAERRMFDWPRQVEFRPLFVTGADETSAYNLRRGYYAGWMARVDRRRSDVVLKYENAFHTDLDQGYCQVIVCARAKDARLTVCVRNAKDYVPPDGFQYVLAVTRIAAADASKRAVLAGAGLVFDAASLARKLAMFALESPNLTASPSNETEKPLAVLETRFTGFTQFVGVSLWPPVAVVK